MTRDQKQYKGLILADLKIAERHYTGERVSLIGDDYECLK